MIKKHIEKGGWYGDCTLEGDYVSLHRDSHIIVNGNRLELPNGENVLYLVCKNYKDKILLYGQGHRSGVGWFYNGSRWVELGLAIGIGAFGKSSLYIVTGHNLYQIYDLETGNVGPSIPMQIGSMGIYYISNNEEVITFDVNYGPLPYNLALWIQRNSYVIGQGYNGGCLGLLGVDYRQIEPGDCQFLKFYEEDDFLAITIVKMPENCTVFYWMTKDEFLNFPIVSNSPNPIPVPPNPEPEPIPPNPIPEPPDPKPEPPKPIPEPIIKEIKELHLMDPEVVSLVSFDHYARIVNGKLVFDRTTENSETDFEISKPDDRFAIKKDGKFVGVDSTIYSGDIRNQYYMTDSRGNYESFFIGTTPKGLIVAFVEYINQGANNTVPFISVPVTIKRKK